MNEDKPSTPNEDALVGESAHEKRLVQPQAPALAQVAPTPVPEAPKAPVIQKQWLVAGGAVVAAVVAFVTVYSLDVFGGGSLGAIVDPKGEPVARLHAEGSGRGVAYEVVERMTASVVVVPLQGPTDGVHYTIQTGGTLQDIARIFAMPIEDLKKLNPKIPEAHFMGPNSTVCVYRPGVALADVEPGAKERLYAGVPISNGPGRRIRRRSRSWGTAYMVSNLEKALTTYGQAYPEGPVVIVSDMSRRKGGRLKPHNTHREGRDVDLSYIPTPKQDNGGFLKMNKISFDLERNWTFISALLESDAVELILMDTYLQKLLYEHLKRKGMSGDELRRIFQYPRDPRGNVGIIRHWEGHRDHMHVRFACAPADPHCD